MQTESSIFMWNSRFQWCLLFEMMFCMIFWASGISYGRKGVNVITILILSGWSPGSMTDLNAIYLIRTKNNIRQLSCQKRHTRATIILFTIVEHLLGMYSLVHCCLLYGLFDSYCNLQTITYPKFYLNFSN